MKYKNLFFTGLFALSLPLQIFGYYGDIFHFDIREEGIQTGTCGKIINPDDYYIIISTELYNEDKPANSKISNYCEKCVKIVYGKKYVVGRVLDSGMKLSKESLDVSPELFEQFEYRDVGHFNANWFFVSCDLYRKSGECLNSSCDETTQTIATTSVTTSTTTTTTTAAANDQKTKITTSFIIILGCGIAVLISGFAIFMLIKKKSKKHYNSDFNSNEEFRNGSIKVVLNNKNNNNAKKTITDNNKNAKVEIKENCKDAIKNESKHSTVKISNNSKVVNREIIKINNNNKVSKNSKDSKSEINDSNNDTNNNTENNNNNNNNVSKNIQSNLNQNNLNQNILNQNNINQNNLNQNILNQNNLNQNILNQNSLNQNILNQNSLNQNMVNLNDFNFNPLQGRNIFIYNFQNSGDFVMSSIPLFNNNLNNNEMQRVPPSFEEEEPLPEYSDVNKSMTKQQYM